MEKLWNKDLIIQEDFMEEVWIGQNLNGSVIDLDKKYEDSLKLQVNDERLEWLDHTSYTKIYTKTFGFSTNKTETDS